MLEGFVRQHRGLENQNKGLQCVIVYLYVIRTVITIITIKTITTIIPIITIITIITITPIITMMIMIVVHHFVSGLLLRLVGSSLRDKPPNPTQTSEILVAQPGGA